MVKQNISTNKILQNKESNVFSYHALNKSLHTRAAIKIQDGCDNYCTFCIIPQVRGRAVSRPANEIIESIKQTLKNGFKEIVITGVNIGRYYHDGVRFVELIRTILDIPGEFRDRISSLEPDGFGNDLAELFENPKLAPHLHLCVQSGSDSILLKM
ncbi:MAG: radical SAM protein [Salinivirgaceae bacterium]|nr:radical SAM protein [Salinivirgaceae bacterium]